MTLAELSDLSQTVAALAVIASLIYLAIQVRHAERNQRALMRQAWTERGIALAGAMQEPSFAGTWVKVTSNSANFTTQDVIVLTSFLRRIALSLLDTHAQHAVSLLSDRAMNGACSAARWTLALPAARAVWLAIVRPTLSAEDAATFEALAVDAVPLAAGVDQLALFTAAHEKLLRESASQGSLAP